MAKKGKKGKDYFGMGRLISIIFAIVMPLSWIFGFVTRFQEKKLVAGLLRLFLGWNIIWVLDLICMIFKGNMIGVII